MKPVLVALSALLVATACADSGEVTEVAEAPVFSPWESKLAGGEAFVKDGDYGFSDEIFHCSLCRDGITRDDALTTANQSGIVWYGNWEDATAELERTGRPLLLHFGSPQVMGVCGVW